MTENEAKDMLDRFWEFAICGEEERVDILKNITEAVNMAIQALEEIQQYRIIGTVEEFNALKEKQYNCTIKHLTNECSYKETGCSDCKGYWEIRELLEKSVAKKPICKSMPYSEDVGMNDEWLCPTCRAYVGYFTEGMNEPEQMEYCNECGQHIARDWTET